VEDLPRLVQRNGEAASEYGASPPERHSQPESTDAWERRRGSGAASSGAQPAAKFNCSPAPSQGTIDAR